MRQNSFILMVTLVASVHCCYGETEVRVPPLASSTILEYAEQKGGIVHIRFTDGYRNNDSPSDIASLRELITETVEKTTAKVKNDRTPADVPLTHTVSHIQTAANAHTTTATVAKTTSGNGSATTVKKIRNTASKAPDSSSSGSKSVTIRLKPKPIDYTLIPDKENRIKCPAKTCGVWNNVMESVCRFCGETLKNSPQIQTAREELLAKQAEAQKRLEVERAMYASKPEPVKAPEPEIKEPEGPSYKTYGLQIKQLGTAYGALAETKLIREGIKTLEDLSLALTDPDRNIQANVRKVLPKLISEENAHTFARALRSKNTQPAAEVAFKGCGYTGAPALFAEIEANNGASAQAVVRSIGPLKEKAVPLVEQRLTPDYIPIYPLLADTLVEIGTPSLSLLTRLLIDTDDEYLQGFASSTLVRFKEKAIGPLITTLNEEQRWERKKRIIECFGQIGVAEAITPLMDFVKTERHGIYLAARESLAQIGTEKALMELGSLFESGSTELVEKTLDLILSSKGPKVKSLSRLAKDSNPRIRRFAVKGLGDLLPSNPSVRPVLQQALNDADRGVKNQAKTSLGQ